MRFSGTAFVKRGFGVRIPEVAPDISRHESKTCGDFSRRARGPENRFYDNFYDNFGLPGGRVAASPSNPDLLPVLTHPVRWHGMCEVSTRYQQARMHVQARCVYSALLPAIWFFDTPCRWAHNGG